MFKPQYQFKTGEIFAPKEKVQATMIRTGGGLPIINHIWLVSASVKVLSSNYTGIVVKYIEKGKLNIRHYGFEDISIALGWQDVRGAFNDPKNNGQIFTSCEDGSLEGMTGQLDNLLFTTLPNNNEDFDTFLD